MTDNRLERWYDERVEAYLDDELADNERRLFEARLALDDELARAVRRARRLSVELAQMPSLECPKGLSRRVYQMTRSGPRLPTTGWILGGALSGAVALALALGADRYLQRSDPPLAAPDTSLAAIDGAEIDAAELARARADVALALAYLDRAGQIAAREVGQQVVTRGVLQPMAAGLEGRGRAAGEEAI